MSEASQAGPAPARTGSADERAAAAVVAHHAQLADDLTRHTERVMEAAEQPGARGVWQARTDLLTWLDTELLPHAQAEEAALYPAAAARPEGKLLVDGMLDEHRTILGLVAELRAAGTPTRAAGAARALTALFGTHLTKENELVVPLILGAGDASLAALLDGMHALLGDHGGHGHDDAQAAAADGCGCGGCGCGGDAAGASDAEVQMLSIDPRLDIRAVPHDVRHATVLAALDEVPAGGALVLVAPHAPRPLLAEIAARYPGQFQLDWLQQGPTVWQLRFERTAVLV
jgi:uncharacterized protein (DUF2249 family)